MRMAQKMRFIFEKLGLKTRIAGIGKVKSKALPRRKSRKRTDNSSTLAQ